jgi:hypothetical protein
MENKPLSLEKIKQKMYKKLRFCDEYEKSCLFKEFCLTEDFSIRGNSAHFVLTNSYGIHLLKCNVEVKIVKDVFFIIISMKPNEKILADIQLESIMDLKKYFRVVNKKNKCGCFMWNNQSRTVEFRVNFRMDPIAKYRGKMHEAVLYYSRQYFLHTQEIYTICSRIDRNMGKLLADANRRSVKNTTKTVEIVLNDFQMANEKQIKQKMLEETKFFVLRNRFNHKETEFNFNTAYYKVRSDCYELEETLSTPDKVFEELKDIAENLAKYSLYFKDCFIPVELFSWADERAIYTYKKPLCEILEVLPALPQNYIKNIMVILAAQFQAKLRNQIYTSWMPTSTVQNASISEETIPSDNATERLALYRDNQNQSTIRYYGIEHKNTACAAIRYKLFYTTLEDWLRDKDENGVYNLVVMIGNIINTLQAKKTSICALDHTCFGFCKHGKLKVLLKATKEIALLFQAPEVQKGKIHRKSLNFSFAWLIAYCINKHCEIKEKDTFTANIASFRFLEEYDIGPMKNWHLSMKEPDIGIRKGFTMN